MARAAAFLALTLLLQAQEPRPEVAIHNRPYTPPSMVLRAETDLVEVPLTVRDKHGQTVAGLQASDFELLDNGVRQKIAEFSEGSKEVRPATAPKYVTFFFDDLHMGVPASQSAALPSIKQAARAFAAQYMKPGDRVSIATTSGLGALDFTGDAKRFADASDRLTQRGAAPDPAAAVNTIGALGAAVKRLSEQPGTRILVFVSSGFGVYLGRGIDVESEVRGLIRTALHAAVTIHAIDAKGLSNDVRLRVLSQSLQEIADGTGGHLFEDTNDIAGAMERSAHPAVSYTLTFKPDRRDGKFHTLKIRFQSRREDSLEFRPGYTSRVDDDSKSQARALGNIDAAVFSRQSLPDIPVTVAMEAGRGKEGGVRVAVYTLLDVNRLPFTISRGRHVQQVVVLTVLLDRDGGFLAGVESTMDLQLKDATLESLKKDGLRGVAMLDAAVGMYQVRTVIREGTKGKLGASTARVEFRPQ